MYEEYHTSADDLNFISPEGLQGAYEVMIELINALEYNGYYKVNVLCEPQLGRRGLYPTISRKGYYDEVKSLVKFVKYCDGKNDLFDISNMIDVPIDELFNVIDKLINCNLIER